MSRPLSRELKWVVPTPELLRELVAAPLPLRLRSSSPERTFHRDIYYDTADGALSRSGVTCRLRQGSDDRRMLTLTLPSAQERLRHDSVVTELDPADSLAGESEAARRLRGLVQPAQLEALAQLHTDRTVRLTSREWPWHGRFGFYYDIVAVRHQGLVRGFQELKARRLRPGAPRLEELDAALSREHGLRAVLESKLARAQRMFAELESEALARAVGGGRSVALIALEQGRIALLQSGSGLRLPSSGGRGEAGCRHLLRETFGSAVGDVTLLGTAPGPGTLSVQEVWLARRLRLGAEPVAGEIVWLPVEEITARAGNPGLNDSGTLAALAVATRSDLLGEREPSPAPVRRAARPSSPLPPEPADPTQFLDPDLSIVEFNLRVLAMAEDPETPLLERLEFLAIVGSNLDEFFMVNVCALKRRGGSGGGQAPGNLEAITLRVRTLLTRQRRCLELCLEEVSRQGLRIRGWSQLEAADRALLEERFRREIFPLLAPRAITMSPGFPVPVIPHLALCIAVILQDAQTGPFHFAYLKLPERVPRFLPVGDSNDLIALEEVVRANLQPLYPERQIEAGYLFRVTRGGDLELAEEDSGNLLQAIEEAVQQRPFNPIVRVEVERDMPQSFRDRLLWELRFERGAGAGSVGELDMYEVGGMLELRGLRELTGAPLPGARYPLFQGRDPLPVGARLWDLLRERDYLFHHPYDSFAATVVRFFEEAAEDSDVAAIRVTLYRAGERSPIVEALARAARAGKEVSIFVELKARFDEARNAQWVRRLEEAGANVVYGVVGLKNHAKVGLVLRREGEELRRYAHVATGNYNASTARVYTDLGLLSSDPELGADIHDLFNELTGSSLPPSGRYRKIAVAPRSLLPWLLASIEGEIEHAKAGRRGRIRAKINGLADTEVVEALYRASRAGVEVELVVRGLCTLRPGVPGLSERIRIVSLLGRFLEHARIYHFGNGGDDRYAIGSADWRLRNLRRRVEVAVPVTQAAARERLSGILDRELSDARAWELHRDGSYARR